MTTTTISWFCPKCGVANRDIIPTEQDSGKLECRYCRDTWALSRIFSQENTIVKENQDGPKFPSVTVQLTGEDGNAFSILGQVKKALRLGGATKEEIDTYLKDAMSGDYDYLLMVTFKWVNVE